VERIKLSQYDVILEKCEHCEEMTNVNDLRIIKSCVGEEQVCPDCKMNWERA